MKQIETLENRLLSLFQLKKSLSLIEIEEKNDNSENVTITLENIKKEINRLNEKISSIATVKCDEHSELDVQNDLDNINTNEVSTNLKDNAESNIHLLPNGDKITICDDKSLVCRSFF